MAKAYLEKAEKIATKQKDKYQLAQSYWNRGRIADLFFSDYSKAKDYMVVAFDNFLAAKSYIEACKCFDIILDYDYRVNKESVSNLADTLKTQLGANFKDEITLFSDNKDADDMSKFLNFLVLLLLIIFYSYSMLS